MYLVIEDILILFVFLHWNPDFYENIERIGVDMNIHISADMDISLNMNVHINADMDISRTDMTRCYFPIGLTMFDINYLSIFNDQTGDNLGHIQFDVRNNQIPPALGQTKIPGWWFDIPTPTPPTVVTNPTR